jgi:hypothetical protein
MEDPLWTIDQVDDWEERIKNYPEHAKDFYRKMIPKIPKFKEM